MKQIFYALCTLFVLLACSKDAEEIPVGGIAGSVADKTTGEPVATVNVTLAPGGKSTVTGSDGTFAFTVLDPGNYSINISKEGYNSNHASVNVKAGQQTATHLLIERIPSIITADRNMLDFGESASLNTLSFNIVNSSYEDLAWEVEHNCPWIKEIKPQNGTLKFGKTETIVVVIDRDLLDTGDNKTVLVVKSTNGSSQVEVKAVGAERMLPVLNTLEVTDITISSATLNGEILNSGTPAYTERGFVYNTDPKPTLENTLKQPTAPVTDSAVYSCRLEGLTLGNTYYVRAYAKNNKGVAYSTNEVSFQPSATLPQVSVQEATDVSVSKGTAVLHGTISNVGEPAYTERGFVFGTISNPTVENTKVLVTGNETGAFSAAISELSLNQTYYVRAYAISAAGVVYSSSEISFTTQTTLPEVSVQEATEVSVSKGTAVLHGTISNVGEPAYTERGFVFGTISNPTVENTKVLVTGNETGAFSAAISELSLNQTYYVRAYAINAAGIAYSSSEISFTTQTTLPEVSVQNATDINFSDGTAVLHGTVVSVGVPAYTERGFVYGTISNPTVENTKVVVTGNGTGAFSVSITELSRNQTYYVRAYAKNKVGYVYSSQSVSFILKPSLPSVFINTLKVNVSDGKATFNGEIRNSGIPAYRERGFVYSIDNETPSINNILDTKIIVEGTGNGNFSIVVTLPLDKIIYVRSYAINEAGVSYSSVYRTSTQAILPTVKTLANTNMMEIGKITFNGQIISTGEPAYTECGFVWGFSENPTIGNNKIVKEGLVGAISFSADVTIPLETIYMRAYAMNRGGVVYAKEQYRILPPWRELPFAGIAVQSADLGKGDWNTANDICKNSRLGNYTNWRLPTKDELAIIYNNKNTIGNFSGGLYWSSYSISNTGANAISFHNGQLSEVDKFYQFQVRCVRSIE